MASVKSAYKRCRGNIVTVLLAMLFAAYYSGTTLFIHTHFLGMGLGTITHSHPYQPGGHHSHSANDFEAIASLDNIVTEEVQCIDAPTNVETLLTILYSKPVSECAAADLYACGQRAPPVCFI